MDRIYIDATATANTLHHTGIQRVVRSLVLHGAVRTEEWVPVVWGGSGYRAPTRNERRRLTEVFSRGMHRHSWLSRWMDRWEKRWEVDFLNESEDSLFLIPEIPAGERLEFLDDLAATGARQMKMAAVCHDLLSWSHPEWTAPSRREGFFDYLRFLGLIERVVCPSRATAGEWRRFMMESGIAGAEAEVLPWPVTGEEQAENEQKSALPLVLSVGTLEVRKNHDRLLDAAEILWKEGGCFELVLAGRLRAKGEREIPDRVDRLREAGRTVSWAGPVDEKTLEELYGRSAFTVFPSLGEGYGLPVAESLARARPCVCSGEGAVGEIAEGGGCIAVDVTRAEALATGMAELLRNEELRKSLAAEAGSRVWPSWGEWMDRFVGDNATPEEGVSFGD